MHQRQTRGRTFHDVHHDNQLHRRARQLRHPHYHLLSRQRNLSKKARPYGRAFAFLAEENRKRQILEESRKMNDILREAHFPIRQRIGPVGTLRQ